MIRQRRDQRIVGSRGGGGKGRGEACVVGEVGGVEEGCEEGGEGFGGVFAGGSALGAGESVVYVWVPGYDGDDVRERGEILFSLFMGEGPQVRL